VLGENSICGDLSYSDSRNAVYCLDTAQGRSWSRKQNVPSQPSRGTAKTSGIACYTIWRPLAWLVVIIFGMSSCMLNLSFTDNCSHTAQGRICPKTKTSWHQLQEAQPELVGWLITLYEGPWHGWWWSSSEWARAF